jgi:hypothetical protein
MNISMGTFIAIACQGEVGTGIENTVAPSATPNPPVIGTPMVYTAGEWSSGTPIFDRWESSADGSVWATAAAMPDFDSPPTDAEFGKVLRVIEVNGIVEAASAATGAVEFAALALLLDASAASTLFSDTAGSTPATADGTTIARWNDGSANALNVTQSTAGSRPTLKTNIKNGLPILRFDGGDSLTRASVLGSLLFDTNAAYIVMVWKQLGSAANHASLTWDATDTGNGVNIHATFGNDLYYDFGSTGGGGRITGGQPVGWDDQWHIVECYRSAATGLIIVDGVTVVSGTFSDALDNSLSAILNIGGGRGTPMTGDLGEIRVYKTPLSAGGRTAMRAYLTDKWGSFP